MAGKPLDLLDDEILRAVATFDPAPCRRSEIESILCCGTERYGPGRPLRVRGVMAYDWLTGPLDRLTADGFLERRNSRYALTDNGRRHVADPLGLTPPP